MVNVTRATRPGVTVGRIVAVARKLLVEGGLEAVTVREVARGLSVSAPALYNHLTGRGEIVDQLAALCLGELTDAVVAARDAAPADDHRERFRAAGLALRDWAHAHPAEFALLFATPAVAFERPAAGVGHRAGLGLGAAFLDIVVPAAAAGRLRDVAPDPLPPEAVAQLRAWRAARGIPLTDGQLWTTVATFHDLMGLVMVETFGQLGFAFTDTDAYLTQRLTALLDSVVVAPGGG